MWLITAAGLVHIKLAQACYSTADHMAHLLQYAAMLPAMLDYADSRKWVLLHDQASGLGRRRWPSCSWVASRALPSADLMRSCIDTRCCHPAGAGGAVFQVQRGSPLQRELAQADRPPRRLQLQGEGSCT